MLPNFVLVGFMGCGKTSVGRHISAMTGHRFLDTDHIVADTVHLTISEIFARYGEEWFREKESAALRDLVGICGVVLATGGGIVLREENRELLHRIGVVIWLDAHPDTLFERVSRTNKRPLLRTENPRASFDALRAERLPIYEAVADLRVDSTTLTHEQAARAAIEGAQRARARAAANTVAHKGHPA
jgi:shikimate kinase